MQSTPHALVQSSMHLDNGQDARMPVLAAALAHRRLVNDNAALRLMRADLLPVVAAVLGEYLGAPGARVSVDEMHERLSAELDEVRDHFDLGNKSAKAYCDDWRDAGLIIRRPALQARGETYELSSEARDALRIVEQLDSPQTTVTESRLVALMAAVHRLALETDTDVTRRLDALMVERAHIDREIERISGGDVEVLDDRRATERLADILLQAQGLPADFARVRARFEELNQELRAGILAVDEVQSTVLDDIFRGVDLIESSDEGRTITAFSSLLRDPEQSSRLDADVTDILDRDFAQGLEPGSRRALRGLVRDLKNGSREVHGVLTDFARGLRRYVYSQEFQRDRVLRVALQEALAAALPASVRSRPFTEIGRELELSAMGWNSVGEVVPHDPSEFDAGESLVEVQTHAVDFAALAVIARETEIDYDELTRNVNDVVRSRGPSTVAEVLNVHEATQGLASVVGLLSLAARFGRVDRDRREQIAWTGAADKHRRTAEIVVHRFTETVPA